MSLFNHVGGVVPRKSLHDLSYQKTFTCDMGQLIPIMCDEVVPGDVFNIGNECVIRFQPLVAPVLQEINAYVHYFFVPYRLLWNDWEKYITGGEDGQFVANIPSWTSTSNDVTTGSLWDYLGLPMTEGLKINCWPKRAYKFVWNEYYRDENLQNELDVFADDDNTQILMRNWEKDYFTSSLPWQQRGIAPSLPVVGVAPVTTISDKISNLSKYFPNSADYYNNVNPSYHIQLSGSGSNEVDFITGTAVDSNKSLNNVITSAYTLDDVIRGSVTDSNKKIYNNNTPVTFNGVDGSNFTSVNIADLRLAFQIQKWLERNARGGARYTEELRSHFGVAPRDERLQRPEYIGGSKSPIVISEVLQTSGSNIDGQSTPQGNLAGHGLTADFNHVSKYRATEYGLIIGLMSVMPRLTYNSQGINRQWLRQTKYDFYWPEFANLSEQAIYKSEIYATTENNGHIFDGELDSSDFFGYQGRYDEMRTKNNMICGEMRSELSYWHMARSFETEPNLNGDFVICNPTKRIFAVQNRNGLVVNFGNNIKALRPIPYISEPGLIDHN